MRRFSLRTGPYVLFGAMLVAALIVFLPMRLALGVLGVGAEGLTARRASGSIWAGTLRDVRFGALALGDLSAGLSPFPLLLGRARLNLETRGDQTDGRLQGAFVVTRHMVGIDGVTASLATGGVFAPVPVTGLDLDGVSVRYVDGLCDRAEGRVTARLGGSDPGIALPAAMTGSPRCEGRALVLPLASRSGTDAAMLRMWADGRYSVALTLAPPDEGAAARLERSGFIATERGHELSIEGRF